MSLCALRPGLVGLAAAGLLGALAGACGGKRGFTEVKPSVALLQGFGARHFVRVA